MNLPRVVVARAHAKINLSLRVVGRRSDGFHELRTVFQSLALHDVLTCVAREGPLSISCDTPGVPLDSTNLVSRAAEALWRVLGRGDEVSGVSITIDKRIPLQAGLGGGSADGAAALFALCRLWNVTIPGERLKEIAASLGADVPFFLWGGTALGLGRGDEIHPLPDAPPFAVVLVLPAFGVRTAEAYSWHDSDAATQADAAGAHVPPLQLPGAMFPAVDVVNDLEPAVVSRHSEIGSIKRALLDAGALEAAMSGSGSSVFGLFAEPVPASRAARLLRRRWRTLCTRTMSRDVYAARMRPASRRSPRSSRCLSEGPALV